MITDATWRLAHTNGLGPRTWRRLHAAFGSDDAIVAQPAASLSRVHGIGPRRARDLIARLSDVDLTAERAACTAAGARLLRLGAPGYPPLLASIPDPPMVLWARGSMDALSWPGLALVGARRATPYGISQAGRFAAQFAASGLAIISGGARGIDAEAHRTALRSRVPTIAVLGCGLSHVYPPEHESLYDDIAAHDGVLVTEHPCAAAPRPGHFPRRNRIISGLALGVVIVEAAARSGALITARLAVEEHGRDVFALPGRADDAASRGCLQLIRDGGAALAADPSDVIDALSPHVNPLIRGAFASDASHGHRAAQASHTAASVTDLGARLIDLIWNGIRTAPELVEECPEHDAHLVQQEVTQLELSGIVWRDATGLQVRQPTHR